jgi:RNA polymerase sigma-70 factor, ECF subfamily
MRAGWCASPGPRREPDRIREERFLLHDMFAVPFEEVGPIVGRSAEALLVVLDRLTPAERLAFVRGSSPEQLASRARRRVRGATAPDPDLSRQREVVDAFLAALRGGDFAGLLAILDPDLVVRTDLTPSGALAEVRGAAVWAKQAVAFGHMARVVRTALVNGGIGLVMATRGRLSRALTFKIANGKITEIEVIGDSARLGDLDVSTVD